MTSVGTTMVHTRVYKNTYKMIKSLAKTRGTHATVIFNELLHAGLKGNTMAKKAAKKVAKKATKKAYGKK